MFCEQEKNLCPWPKLDPDSSVFLPIASSLYRPRYPGFTSEDRRNFEMNREYGVCVCVCVHWVNLSQERNQWRVAVSTAMFVQNR